jgi:hypothetical protein
MADGLSWPRMTAGDQEKPLVNLVDSGNLGSNW